MKMLHMTFCAVNLKGLGTLAEPAIHTEAQVNTCMLGAQNTLITSSNYEALYKLVLARLCMPMC